MAVDAVSRAAVGALVVAEDAESGLRYTTRCKGPGGFLLPHVAAGSYHVTIEAPGLVSQAVENIVVQAGGTVDMVFRLRFLGAATVVQVTDSDNSLEEPAGDATSSVIASSTFDELPLNGRRWQSFALLTPAINAADGDLGSAMLSARGLATTQNSYTLDGLAEENSFHAAPRGGQSVDDATVNDETVAEPGAESGGAQRGSGSWRRSGAAYSFSQVAVREFRIGTQNYSALYGHGAGAAIASLSRGGSNVLHGSAFYVGRSSAFAATNPFSIATSYRDGAITSRLVKPPDLRHQFGATVGGPAIHDRLFYFYAFDQQRRGFDGISSPEDPGFYALTATQRALLANRGVTSGRINAALNYIDSLTGTVHRRDDQNIHFIKLDWQAASRHRFSVQYNRLRSAVPAGLRGAPVIDRGIASLGSGETKVDAIAARWTWTASARLFHDLRFAYGRDLQFETAQRPLPQEPAIANGGFAPQITIAPYGFSFGTPADVGRNAYPDEHRTQLSDTLTWSIAGHLLQVGGQLSAIHDRVSELNNTLGTFRYDSGSTNGRVGGLVDWITDYTFSVNSYPNGGCPAIYAAVHLFCFQSYTQSFGEQSVAWSTQDWSAFVQDSWRPRRNLAISAGVRYEYVLLPLPQRVNAALDAVFRNRGATGIFPEDRNNFGPRLSVAWAPFGERRGVVRLGYGVYYGRVTGGTVRSVLANTALTSSSLHIRITPSTITACPQNATQGFGYVCSYNATPPAAVADTTSATVFSRRYRTPMVQQGTFAIEREAGRSVVVSATYLMNIDHQLQGSTDLNISPSITTKVYQLIGGTTVAGARNGDRFVLPAYTERLYGGMGPVTAVTSDVHASYNALAFEVRQRSRAGLTWHAAWTWSKAIDEAQSMGGMPRTNAQLDPFDIRYDKGLSRLNFPHKLVVSATWTPRVRTTEPVLHVLASDWTASGIFYETSGRPYSYEISGGDRLSGSTLSINGSGGAIYLPTVGRNTLRLPDTARLDLRVARGLRLGDHLRGRVGVEAFNLFNRVNYTGVQQRAFLVGDELAGGVTPLIFQDAAAIASSGLNVRPFGDYSEAGSNNARERQLQLALRLEF